MKCGNVGAVCLPVIAPTRYFAMSSGSSPLYGPTWVTANYFCCSPLFP